MRLITTIFPFLPTVTVTMINVYSIPLAASVMNIFTTLKTAAVVMISVVGIIRIAEGRCMVSPAVPDIWSRDGILTNQIS
jgi:hypothetical protein